MPEKYCTETLTKNNIPKIVHQVWIGKKMPKILKLYTDNWRRMRGWDYKLWGNDDLTKENFPKTWKYIKKILRRKKPIYAMIADLMRLEILYHHGGVYVDTSIEKKKNLTKLLNKKGYKFAISNEIPDKDLEYPYISNSFISSEPHHKILDRLLSKKNLDSINFRQNANLATGPYFLRKGVKTPKEITYIPTNLIYPFSIEYSVPDSCLSYTEKKNFKEYEFFNNKFYIKYPCTSYNKAYMIKHWDIGGTWINKK